MIYFHKNRLKQFQSKNADFFSQISMAMAFRVKPGPGSVPGCCLGPKVWGTREAQPVWHGQWWKQTAARFCLKSIPKPVSRSSSWLSGKYGLSQNYELKEVEGEGWPLCGARALGLGHTRWMEGRKMVKYHSNLSYLIIESQLLDPQRNYIFNHQNISLN